MVPGWRCRCRRCTRRCQDLPAKLSVPAMVSGQGRETHERPGSVPRSTACRSPPGVSDGRRATAVATADEQCSTVAAAVNPASQPASSMLVAHNTPWGTTAEPAVDGAGQHDVGPGPSGPHLQRGDTDRGLLQLRAEIGGHCARALVTAVTAAPRPSADRVEQCGIGDGDTLDVRAAGIGCGRCRAGLGEIALDSRGSLPAIQWSTWDRLTVGSAEHVSSCCRTRLGRSSRHDGEQARNGVEAIRCTIKR